MKWTHKKKEKLFLAFSDGLSAKEIADELGTTKNSVISCYNRYRTDFDAPVLKSVGKVFSEEDKALAMALYLDGMFIDDIAKRFDRSKASIEAFLRKTAYWKREQTKQALVKTSKLEKPTPENTVIRYEFTEYDMPENALMIPFVDIEPGQCTFVSGTFWDESGPQTKCCGLGVIDRKARGMKRSYCQYHYNISVEVV